MGCIISGEASHNVAVTREAFLELGLVTVRMLQNLGESDSKSNY